MKKNIKVLDSAMSGVAYLIRREHEVFFTSHEVGVFRHTIFSPPVTRDDIPSYYVLFKREFLWSFNKQFPVFVKEQSEYRGVGESINKNSLYGALTRSIDYLLFVYPDGKVYRISPKGVRNFCQKNNLIRTQDKVNNFKVKDGTGKSIPIRETTYSFPVQLLEYMGDV